MGVMGAPAHGCLPHKQDINIVHIDRFFNPVKVKISSFVTLYKFKVQCYMHKFGSITEIPSDIDHSCSQMLPFSGHISQDCSEYDQKIDL